MVKRSSLILTWRLSASRICGPNLTSKVNVMLTQETCHRFHANLSHGRMMTIGARVNILVCAIRAYEWQRNWPRRMKLRIQNTMGDFTFWIIFRWDQRLRPKFNLNDKVWSQSGLRISWAEIVLKIEQFVSVLFFSRFFSRFRQMCALRCLFAARRHFWATIYQLLSLLLLATLFVYIYIRTKQKVKSVFTHRNVISKY